MNNDTKDKIWRILGCLIWALIPIGLYFVHCSSHSKKESEEERLIRMQDDSIRRVHIRDSLYRELHYQDSLRRAKEGPEEWWALHDSICNKEIVGFVFEGESVYHNFIHGMIEKEDGRIHKYSLKDMPKIRFVTNCDIERESLYECDECENYIEQYVLDNIEYFSELFEDDDDY